MPNTTLNWKRPTSRPRFAAGAISAMYMGPITEDPPMASPPTKRKQIRADQLQVKAHPKADSTYKTPSARKQPRRPKRSLGGPANSDPKTVPHKALATVKPSMAGEREYIAVRARVVPAM